MNDYKNPEKIEKMFDEISNYYDKMNNFISFGMHYFIKKSSIKLLKIKEKSKILDLCTGTGDNVDIISKDYGKIEVIGVDKSEKMLEKARIKNPQTQFLYADATDLPFQNDEFDFVIMSFGLRNIQNREKAIVEVYRILKENGKFLHLDFGEHNFLNKFFNFFLLFIIKIFKINQDNYKYLIKSKNNYPAPNELVKEFEIAGFKFFKRKDFLFGAISAQVMVKRNCSF